MTQQFHPKYIPKRNKNLHTHRKLYVNVYTNFIHNSYQLMTLIHKM
jgi:hypothetical protein